MKKATYGIGIAGYVLLIGVVVAGLCYMIFGRVQIGDVIKAEIHYEGSSAVLDVSDQESVQSLLQGKFLYKDSPACGFEDTPFVVFTYKNGDTQTFCSAFDDCPIVYYKEKNIFCRLSQEENAQFRALLGEVEK